MDNLRWVTGSTQEAAFAALEASAWTPRFTKPTPAKYTVVIVATSEEEYNSEKDRMLKRRTSTKAVSTPKGSTFTPFPLGKYSPVCLVFGDAMSAYSKCLSRQLTALPHLSPRAEALFDGVIPDDSDPELPQQDKNALSFVQSWTTMQQVLEMGISPATATGFSLGGLVMEWCHAPLTPSVTKALAKADAGSPLWQGEALCGAMNLLRKKWGIPASAPVSDFWSAWFLLDVDVDELMAGLDKAARVRVVVIESDRRCIIVGHPQDCKAMAAARGLSLTPFTMSLLAHNDWIPHDMAEQAGLAYWNPATTTKSASDYAADFADMYTNPVDFRGQVREAYDQGCRVFLEVGCDNKRTGAIAEILKDSSDVLALAMDGKVGDPKTQHRRVWAQLVSHGFDLGWGKGAKKHGRAPVSPKSVAAELEDQEVSDVLAWMRKCDVPKVDVMSIA